MYIEKGEKMQYDVFAFSRPFYSIHQEAPKTRMEKARRRATDPTASTPSAKLPVFISLYSLLQFFSKEKKNMLSSCCCSLRHHLNYTTKYVLISKFVNFNKRAKFKTLHFKLK